MPLRRSPALLLNLLLLGELFFFCFDLPLAYSAARVDAAWLRLLHYRTSYGSELSSIDSPDFFVASQGRDDPEAEWNANLELLQKTEMSTRGRVIDPQCVFPARALYFRERGLLPDRPRSCPEYETFRDLFKIESMSLVFSTAYAGNAASMFGHTLLKLNRSTKESGGGLLDYGVAFLALSDPTDGALYALKGLLGGYPGFYTVQPYYELVNQYAYNENRDLWELPIALTTAERERLIAHLWELTEGASASYYFGHVNCAAMLAELIDVVRPSWNIRASISGFVMPSELMRAVGEKVKDEDSDKVPELAFRASQKRRWLDKMSRLDSLQREIYRKAWSERSIAGAETNGAVLDVLLDRIILEKGALDLLAQKPVRAFEQVVLRARAELPPKKDEPVEALNNPLVAHAPKRFALSGGGMDDDTIWGLRLRAGWHDLLDSPLGFEPSSQLNFFDLNLRKSQKSSELSELDFKIADVWSLNPWRDDDHHFSWTMGGGARYQNERRSVYFRSSTGISFAPSIFLISFLPGAEVEGDFTVGRAGLKGFVRAQSLMRWTSKFRSLAAIEPFANSEGRRAVDWSLESRWDLSRNYQMGLVWDRRSEMTEGKKKGDDERWEISGALSY